uniref:Uncharacterized protein n=1 Tax=Syphacia muris TaxID=451379 RepID=A0A0N5AGN7_9BILA
MLGIMMNPENVSEFYAGSKKAEEEQQQELFIDKPRRPTISYLRDGRVVIDGEVKQSRKSLDLWNDTLKRSLANRLQMKAITKQRSQSEGDVSWPITLNDKDKKRVTSEEFLDDLIMSNHRKQ